MFSKGSVSLSWFISQEMAHLHQELIWFYETFNKKQVPAIERQDHSMLAGHSVATAISLRVRVTPDSSEGLLLPAPIFGDRTVSRLPTGTSRPGDRGRIREARRHGGGVGLPQCGSARQIRSGPLEHRMAMVCSRPPTCSRGGKNHCDPIGSYF